MTRRYDIQALTAFSTAVLDRLGADADEAAVLADSLTEGQLRAPIYSNQGFVRLVVYAQRVRDGGIQPRAKMRVLWENATTAVLDGANGFGQVAAARGMRLAVEKAKSAGLGVVGVRNSNHFGMAGYHALLAADAGCLGIAVTNASPEVPAAGGAQPLVGTNPWSIAAPVLAGDPIVLDVSNSQALGKSAFHAYAARHEPLPAGWAVDAQGLPTVDAKAALAGIVAPMGGYKGVAIAVMMDVLAGVLTGARFGSSVGSPYATAVPQGVGHLMIAIGIEAFGPLDAFRRRTRELTEQLRASRRAPGVDRVYVPGEPEAERRSEQVRNGCRLLEAVEVKLRALATDLDVAFPAELLRPRT